MQIEKLGALPETARPAMDNGAFFVTRPRLVPTKVKTWRNLVHRAVIFGGYNPISKCAPFQCVAACCMCKYTSQGLLCALVHRAVFFWDHNTIIMCALPCSSCMSVSELD